MTGIDTETRREAIRTLGMMRDAHLVEWSTCRGTHHRGEARDLHAAIQIISADGGLQCEPFEVVAARVRQARWLPPGGYPADSRTGDQP